jgi:hypothetical protein
LRALALLPQLEQDAGDGWVHVVAETVDDENVLLLGAVSNTLLSAYVACSR